MARRTTSELVAAIRQRTGLTQESLARRLGVSFPTVNAWERGRAHPRSENLAHLEEMALEVGLSKALGVLVIDDDPVSCEVIQSFLGDCDVATEITTVIDGSEGLLLCGDLKPDLLLLDVLMPGIDGFEVARRLHLVPGLDRTTVVFMTASTDSRLLDRIRATGRSLLIKPVSFEDLCRTLEDVEALAVSRRTSH